MIRINLIGVERQKTRQAFAFDAGQRVSLACVLVVVAGALVIGGWYWSLAEASARLDEELAVAQQEAARLQPILAEVRQFEERRGVLQQRVSLIEQLRGSQSVPVQLVDHVSRSLPDLVWLTQLEQQGNQVTIQGRSMTLIALSDFVGNLGNGPLLARPIDIVNSQVESVGGRGQAVPTEVIGFTVRARMAGAAASAGR